MKSDPRKMTPDEYQDHMDVLAKKIGRVMEGERVEDGIIACAACAAFGLVQIPPDKRAQIRNHINAMIDDIVKEADARQKPDNDGTLVNMGRINTIMGLLGEGKITRDECRQRLIRECSVADHNLDMLLNAYDKKANN
ncbi:MAG TPA: hypothetical protein VFP43_22535 [Mesorhizobium sp.]|nr:hypothetical protein [Mesorhizobium sp.]